MQKYGMATYPAALAEISSRANYNESTSDTNPNTPEAGAAS